MDKDGIKMVITITNKHDLSCILSKKDKLKDQIEDYLIPLHRKNLENKNESSRLIRTLNSDT